MKRNGRPFTGFAATLCVLLLTASLMSSAGGWYEEGNRTSAGGKPANIARTVSGNQREEPAEAAPQIAIPPLTLDAIPEYAGEPYVAVNNNIPFFTEADLTADAFERYSALDRLGRCGRAVSAPSVVSETFAPPFPALLPPRPPKAPPKRMLPLSEIVSPDAPIGAGGYFNPHNN